MRANGLGILISRQNQFILCIGRVCAMIFQKNGFYGPSPLPYTLLNKINNKNLLL